MAPPRSNSKKFLDLNDLIVRNYESRIQLEQFDLESSQTSFSSAEVEEALFRAGQPNPRRNHRPFVDLEAVASSEFTDSGTGFETRQPNPTRNQRRFIDLEAVTSNEFTDSDTDIETESKTSVKTEIEIEPKVTKSDDGEAQANKKDDAPDDDKSDTFSDTSTVTV